MTADQTIIYFSKGKLLRLLLFSILFIAGTFPIGQAREAFEQLEAQGKQGKLVLRID